MDPIVVRDWIVGSSPSSGRLNRRAAQSGFASIQWVAGMAVALVGLLFVVNLVAIQYARGALTAAARAGARAGVVIGGSLEDCEREAEKVLSGPHGLLNGVLGAGATVSCTRHGETVGAVAEVAVGWWLGPSTAIHLAAGAVRPLESDGRLLTGSPPSSGSWDSP